MRAEQTVSEMVTEALARQAEALAEVLETPAGRLLAELTESRHRHEKAAYWQAALRAEAVGRSSLPAVTHSPHASSKRSGRCSITSVGARGPSDC